MLRNMFEKIKNYIPLAVKKIVWKILRTIKRTSMALRLSTDYKFHIGDYWIFIFSEWGTAKKNIQELGEANELSKLKIENFEFYWPKNQSRKELGALWQEVFNPRILNPHSYDFPEGQINSGDTVIDAGVCEGFFARYALLKNARVMGFEPLNTLKKCLENTFVKEISNGQVKLFQALLGDENRESGISADPDMLCMSSQDESDAAQKCPMITLDQWMENEKISKVDFIKMDIEGGEINAFKGAAKLIKTFKPKLAIAVYHEYENAKLIRDMLKTYRPDYKIEFRGIWDYGNVRPRPYMLLAR